MIDKVLIVSGIAASLLSPSAQATVFSERPEVKQFVDEMHAEHQIDREHMLTALSQIESSDEIIKRISTPAEALSWDKYRKIFLGPERINDGVKFWQEHYTTLQQAEKHYGVPAQYIVAIIGVESFYGKHGGKYPVLQALATLAFDYPPRAPFFRSELKQYFLLTMEQGLDPLALKGSYAGAMGTPQFIASSYRNYAVDFDGSGQIDLINNTSHAIGSVGNYFKVHGWQAGHPVAYKVHTKGAKLHALPIAAKNNPVPEIELAKIKEHGVTIKDKIHDHSAKVALLEFQGSDQEKEYWLGLKNFYVITRYNRSSNYAMAVYQLSQELARLRKEYSAKGK